MHIRKYIKSLPFNCYRLCVITALIIGGCVYYNTMFNALDKYDSALTRLNQSTNPEIPQDIRKDFEITIDKCWKLINIYGEDSNYSDDALLLIAKSHYHLQEYTKSERFARQMIMKYPESDLFAEGNLWLAKSLIKLNRGEDAIEFLNIIIDSEADDDLRSRAWFSLGELYYHREQFLPAIEKLETSIEFAEDELLVSEGRFLIGKIYFETGDFTKAADQLEILYDYDEPIGIIFESQMLRVAALLKLDDPDEALFVLKLMSRETQFYQYQDLIQAKIGDCLVYDQQLEEAIDQYDYTMRIHPRTSGSAAAAYGLAQIFDHTYADFDSARKLYLRVKQEDRNSELNITAGSRAIVLDQYLKLSENIRQDLLDLHPDSLAESEENQELPDSAEVQNVTEGIIDSSFIKSANQTKTPARTVKRRSAEEIQHSLIKNNFALAEFFLLNMQNYDSAEVAYKRFIATYQDSVLVPKSYYALYYLYDFELKHREKADSIKNIILSDYPESVYAEHLLKEDLPEQQKEVEVDSVKKRYRLGENLMFAEDYPAALSIFEEIAVTDSGSVWAEKARYAIGWIYEKKLQDIENAIIAYGTVVKEYPNSAYSKIAKLKIQPPPEPENIDTVGVTDTSASVIDTVTTDTQQTDLDRESIMRLEKIIKDETATDQVDTTGNRE